MGSSASRARSHSSITMVTCVAGRDGSRQGQRIAEAGLIRYGSVLSPAALAGGRKAAESSFKLQVITDACIPHPSALPAAPKSWYRYYRTVPGICFRSCVRVHTCTCRVYLPRVIVLSRLVSHTCVGYPSSWLNTEQRTRNARIVRLSYQWTERPLPSHSGCSLPAFML